MVVYEMVEVEGLERACANVVGSVVCVAIMN